MSISPRCGTVESGIVRYYPDKCRKNNETFRRRPRDARPQGAETGTRARAVYLDPSLLEMVLNTPGAIKSASD